MLMVVIVGQPAPGSDTRDAVLAGFDALDEISGDKKAGRAAKTGAESRKPGLIVLPRPMPHWVWLTRGTIFSSLGPAGAARPGWRGGI